MAKLVESNNYTLLMTLPNTTTSQQIILTLLYKYRYLERKHVQLFFNHKDKRRSTKWLKDLKEKQFVDWIYNIDDTYERSKPAVFFLGINGLRYIRALRNSPEGELRKRYKDGARQRVFIDHCLLLADCCLHLEKRNKLNNNELHYKYALEADYSRPDNDFYYLNNDVLIHPELAFIKKSLTGDINTTQTYLMQLFSIHTPRYMIKKKLRAYLEYLLDDVWEENNNVDSPPIILITCPTLSELIYAKRCTKKLLTNILDDEIPENIKIRFTTLDKLRSNGLTAVIWEDL